MTVSPESLGRRSVWVVSTCVDAARAQDVINFLVVLFGDAKLGNVDVLGLNEHVVALVVVNSLLDATEIVLADQRTLDPSPVCNG